jgi:hypothetical protein
MADGELEEIQLAGGMGSGGAVVRVGDTVRRPLRPESAAVHEFLRHLEAVGFDGAPRYLGHDDQGRAVLSWVPGDVAVPPFPAWAADEELLVSVAVLQRRLHEAARSFVAPPDAIWERANVPPRGPDDLVCHNDLCIENVVVRDGRAVAFIDFDFAAPASPLFDIAVALRHWLPVRDPADVASEWQGLDPARRFRLFTDAHGLDSRDQHAVIEHGLAFLDRALVAMKAKADSGLPLYQVAWESGYPDQNRRSRAWLADHAGHLLAG